MISGAHAIIFSADPEADRAFFRDVIGLESADAGGGWLIFALPPSELAVHPVEEGKPGHEIYLMTDDLDRTIGEIETRGVEVDPNSHDQPWGRLAFIRLPGGSRLGVYQPRHPRPEHRPA